MTETLDTPRILAELDNLRLQAAARDLLRVAERQERRGWQIVGLVAAGLPAISTAEASAVQLAKLSGPSLVVKNGALATVPTEESVIGVDKAKRAATAVISTRTRDRGGDIVEPSGISLAHYAANPVVLFSHNHDAPVGMSETPTGQLAVKIERDRVLATCYFHQTDEAEEVFQRVARRELRGASIGFMPIGQPELLIDDETGERGHHFERIELLEWSWCVIPMCAECLLHG